MVFFGCVFFKMHHVLIVLTVTFIQGHTDRNHENNTCLIISETIQAMSIKFAVKISLDSFGA